MITIFLWRVMKKKCVVNLLRIPGILWHWRNDADHPRTSVKVRCCCSTPTGYRNVYSISQFFGIESTATSNFPNKEARWKSSNFSALDKNNQLLAFCMTVLRILSTTVTPTRSRQSYEHDWKQYMKEIWWYKTISSANNVQQSLPENCIKESERDIQDWRTSFWNT